ncbi:unnamed protein product [Medioppia subpectinata]|uniref:Uncharacterized protein n=1 Tax=Medioppia subpectinata TaxID=1979941 RepID=A0A7R9KPC4_9ACAR|nr:unnamed protein product [Medioppia subpectinata]CAG2106191.1 unnamed protein product [Medioppia subpectinata]
MVDESQSWRANGHSSNAHSLSITFAMSELLEHVEVLDEMMGAMVVLMHIEYPFVISVYDKRKSASLALMLMEKNERNYLKKDPDPPIIKIMLSIAGYIAYCVLLYAIRIVGSFAGFSIIIVCQTLEVFIFPNIFQDVPYSIYIAELALPLLGFTLGYIAASIFRLQHSFRRTIAIEAGIQNVGTALTIISLSFPYEWIQMAIDCIRDSIRKLKSIWKVMQLPKVWLFPFMYAFSMFAICIIIATIYRLHKRFFGRSLDIVLSEKSDKFGQSPGNSPRCVKHDPKISVRNIDHNINGGDDIARNARINTASYIL